MSDIVFPTVHLNGTSKLVLLKGAEDAYNSVDAAIAKLCEASPNARDYYVQGPDAFTKAANQHRERLAKLQVVAAELIAIYQNLEEQA